MLKIYYNIYQRIEGVIKLLQYVHNNETKLHMKFVLKGRVKKRYEK